MKKDNQAAVKAFMGETEKLLHTNQTMEDIYNAIVERNPKAWIAIYFHESGKARHQTYDEFRSLVRIVDAAVEERAVIRMFGDALIAYTAPGVSTYGFLNVCRSAGLFGSAANKTAVLESIVAHADEERKELQKLLVAVWRQSEPLFERKLLEAGTRRQDIEIAEYGQMHNRIAQVGQLVTSGKAPQQAMREYRLLAMDINLFCGAGNLGDGWKPDEKEEKD